MVAAHYHTNDFDYSLFFALCNNLREGTAVIEASTKEFIYCNQSFLKLFNINALTDIDRSLYQKLRKETLSPDVIAEREKILKEKGYFYELVEYISLNGDTFFGEATIQYFATSNSHFYFVIINPVDKAFFDLASLGILMVNKDGDIVTANPFILNQFGYTKSELVGKKVELLIPRDVRNKHVALRQQFAQAPADRTMGAGINLSAEKKDGTSFPVEISLGHYPSDGDRYIVAFVNDISVKKQAEDGLKKLNEQLEFIIKERTQALNDTLTQLEISKAAMQHVIVFQKALLDNAGAMIVSVNEKGIIQTFNPEAEKELGYQAEELIGKHSPLIYHDPLHIEARAKEFSKELNINIIPGMEVFYAKARLGMHNENEWIYIRKDGSKFPVQLNVTVVKNAEGVITGYIGVALNISKLKKYEQDLQEALEREKELGELKSRFVSMASHEFRTPLSTILSSSYLIEKYTGTSDQGKREKHLQRIVSSVNMLSDILNDFLSVGKIEEGKIQVRLTEFNIKELVSTVIAEMKSSFKPHQKISYQHQGSHKVILDASFMKHIVMNLVSNASKFSGEGSVIEVTTVAQKCQLIFSIKDHGMGISKEDQAHLMERFFRGTNAANIQGTGLGLHIVAKYAELMNGVVQCNSELEKGTEFIISFKT